MHTAIGQEIIPAIISEALKNTYVISNHRGHGHFIAHTGNIEGLFAEFLSRAGAVSAGLGGSQHLRQIIS